MASLLHLGRRFRGGLVFKAHRLCVSLNSRLESNKDEDYDLGHRVCRDSRKREQREPARPQDTSEPVPWKGLRGEGLRYAAAERKGNYRHVLSRST